MSTAPAEIKTSRLRMRRLRTDDISEFAAMNTDPQVMEFFPRVWSFSESQTILRKINSSFDERGFGTYAVEFERNFAGVIGLSVPSFEAPFTPCVEILWRLRPRFWGKGIASEGAAAILDLAFRTLLLREVVAFTAAINSRSIRVMERLGMKKEEDFEHPTVTDARLKRHVLYRASAELFLSAQGRQTT
jgi:RimJ/RimL family protein N-acetyltransferase